jgi:two-component system sensor histidine kinase UhpB
MPLLWRLFIPNAAVLIAATAALMLSPATISNPPQPTEALVVISGLVAMLLLNLAIISRTIAPLRYLTRVMRKVDPLEPGQRVDLESRSSELIELSAVFNGMLERLETERRESGRRMLAAQEAERRRVARELHDEVGQTVTGLMLELGHAAASAPDELAAELREAREEARLLSDRLQAIVRQLRPDALDDLGLASALTNLSEGFGGRFGIRVRRRLSPTLPAISPETELVIYRTAQESLTNVARHAEANTVDLELSASRRALRLVVRDHGCGINGARPGSGIRGMRERALLLGGRLTLSVPAGGGTEVQLEVPMSNAR